MPTESSLSLNPPLGSEVNRGDIISCERIGLERIRCFSHIRSARPFFLDALNIPVPPIAFITGLLESNSKGIVIRFKKVNCHWSKKGQEENQDKGDG